MRPPSAPSPSFPAERQKPASFWTPQEIAASVGGRWLAPPADPMAQVRGLSTDSRAINAGQAFLALAGDKFDGHDFIEGAARAGASLLIVQRPPPGGVASLAGRPAVLEVADTLLALQALAARYRDRLEDVGCRVIAVAGSNGKTTTRHLIHSLLSVRLKGTQSPKSFNNHIGVPLTLLGASEKDAFVVVEAGTNHPGELAALGRIVRPDAAVVTSIGQEHMEFFKTLEGVAQEEASILSWVKKDGLVVATDDTLLDPHLKALEPGRKIVRFGESARANPRLTDCRIGDGTDQHFRVDGGPERRISLLGRHNALNAIAAVAVAQWMGLDDAAVAQALASATGVPMRLTVAPMGKAPNTLLLINDAYNANPDSMAAALGTLLGVPRPAPGAPPGSAGRRVAVLGDMLELGDSGPDQHRGIGTLLARLDAESRAANPRGGIDLVIVIGRLSLFIAQALGKAWPGDRVQAFAMWDDSVPARVAALLEPGDIVLLKASRGMGLERLVPAVRQRFPAGD
ncbi:MAG: UDP-N-acetylmuramoyl-tripeptide--D-alanyl-D-alanine ligase [Planctomycetota bacterium]|nr:UDP-N-acetylmuramoyl-tripeptide--D-alanyl-D-alanine ligase [Planctomycetota bacterium]